MWDVAAFSAGFALIAVGALSLLYPLRWIGIRTRAIALLVIATGFLVVALGSQMLDSYLIYFGFALIVLGGVSLLRPLRFFFIRNRSAALLVLIVGGLLFFVVLFLPYGEKKALTPTTKLDQWMPRWQVSEKHIVEINATPEKIFASIHAVTADEIFLFRTLIAIRRCGQGGPESILNPSANDSLLDVATRTSFVLLEEIAPREIVVGTVIAAPREAARSGKLEPALFRRTLRPGVVLATMNFVVVSRVEGRSTLTTETRVYANSPAMLRRFGIYWRIIHPGSDIIRRMWLRAIAQRAEKA